ncbi:cation efflux system protein [Alsobacter metallidurans]|uniref:Cation efflux system protein n=1 Tax=Alsobacter metallidurans TaxID=340221 RepID=A0A917I682_9HYPH|nr:efflux RND transporter periplasmic adaptor subunit [Alsobacter metallidurans]GGH15192.1 cation efflux system protein [Alsobacter metallidurans]
MSRPAWSVLVLAALAASILGYGAGRAPSGALDLWGKTRALLGQVPAADQSTRNDPGVGPVVYYRDPDGRPAYSSEPARTADGRNFLAVRRSADLSFDDPAQPGVKEARASGRVLYYRNPMGLPDTSPTPKKDSMGMDYIAVREGEDEPGVRLSPGKLQRTGVRSTAAERRVVAMAVRAPGVVQLDERRVSVVALRSDGFVEKVENVTTGDRVRKGQPLLQLYSPEVSAAAAQYLTGLGIEGARRRLENLAVPQEAITEIERSRRAPTSFTWTAPRDGVVLARNAVEGMRATAGEALFRIADTSSVWVVADIPEADLARVSVGQEASVTMRGLPGRTFIGRVTIIYPQVEKVTRTARARIEIANRDGALLPDMYAEVSLATGPKAEVVAVPDSAVLDTGARRLVLLDMGEGRFEPRDVETGSRGGGWVEIRSGLEAGEAVVTAANFLIDAESNLRSALQGMAHEAEASP